jgi:hypothetical protein
MLSKIHDVLITSFSKQRSSLLGGLRIRQTVKFTTWRNPKPPSCEHHCLAVSAFSKQWISLFGEMRAIRCPATDCVFSKLSFRNWYNFMILWCSHTMKRYLIRATQAVFLCKFLLGQRRDGQCTRSHSACPITTGKYCNRPVVIAVLVVRWRTDGCVVMGHTVYPYMSLEQCIAVRSL